MNLNRIAASTCFGGRQMRFNHTASSLDCQMTFSIYLPPQADQRAVPLIYWLSGLTCTDENFMQKAGAQRYAAEHGVAIVTPDTSPRGTDVAADPEGGWDFGLGAGFYLNATQPPYRQHYQMYDYVTLELPQLLATHFPVDPQRVSIMGHSMGGHGALTIALKNPDAYKAVSAFSPICNPCNCPWGQKAFSGYLGDDLQAWKAHDACELIRGGTAVRLQLLVDQGSADDFLESQLHTAALAQACEATGLPLSLRMREGYDHSYFFIATFIGEHIAYHASALMS